MRGGLALLVFAAALATAQPALACRPPAFSADIFDVPRTDFAAILVENATYIDLAVAERAEPLTELDGWVRQLRDAGFAEPQAEADRASMQRFYRNLAGDLRRRGAARIVFRGLEKLKGEGPSWFTLNGLWQPRGESQFHVGGDLADVLTPRSVWYTFGGPYEISRNQLGFLCSLPLTARPGQRYLVFRDRDGRLLGPTIPFVDRQSGEMTLRPGFVFEPVASGFDPWLDLVREKASFNR